MHPHHLLLVAALAVGALSAQQLIVYDPLPFGTNENHLVRLPTTMQPSPALAGSTEDMKIGTQNFMKNGPKVKAAFVHR